MKYIGSAWKESNILQPLNFMFELSPTVEPTALAQARATLPPLRKALAQQRDLLAALAGTFPNRGPRQSFKLADLHLPADLPVSVPSQLVEQRPDIRAAEEQLHAASAQVGIATANTLPSFTINPNAGF